MVEVYALFFLHVGSRRVFLAGVTPRPDAAWVTQQARNLTMHFDEKGLKASHLLRDHDSKFTAQFDDILSSEGVEVKAVGPLAPNLNAYAERFVQSAKGECLRHFVFLGEKHLRHVLAEYVAHYNQERPHQGVGNVPLGGQPPVGPAGVLRLADVVCDQRLGGLLKHYGRAA